MDKIGSKIIAFQRRLAYKARQLLGVTMSRDKKTRPREEGDGISGVAAG